MENRTAPAALQLTHVLCTDIILSAIDKGVLVALAYD